MRRPKQKIILRGIGASPGRVRGKVKIINFPEEVNELNRGEMMVTSFLRPDFISAIRMNSTKISGIITDKGGLTCHAAIVVRELKVPYIARTVVATKKLKENMMITIDGGKGFIYGKIR